MLILESLPLSNYVKQHLFAKFAAVSRATVKGPSPSPSRRGRWAVSRFLSPASTAAFCGAPDGVPVADSGGRFGHYLGAGGHLPLCHRSALAGAFIVGFFVIVIGLVDNILRPLLVGKDTKMPDYLILIATLGGMEIYGINGFVIGPLIAALFIACWNLLSGRDTPAIPMKSMKSSSRKEKSVAMNEHRGSLSFPRRISLSLIE
jgi:hypothetical protein